MERGLLIIFLTLMIVFSAGTNYVFGVASGDGEAEAESEMEVIDGRYYLEMEEIVVTATRTRKRSFEVPNTVHILKAEEIRNVKQAVTLPEALNELPGVMVQKTATGMGSPFIRGFTGFRTLLLIDGIRLNNSVFRDGPNQYWNTVDVFLGDRFEVIKGPTSVLYGSDAIGGTLNLITDPPTFFGESRNWGSRLCYQYASAMDANIGRAELNGALTGELALHVGGTYKNFGNVEGGGDVGIQPKTGYDDVSGEIKLQYLLNDDSRFILAHQQTALDDIWRTHKTIYGISWKGTDVGNEKQRTLDQERKLSYIQFEANNLTSLIDDFSCSLSYHTQQEERFRIKSDDSQDRQGFDVNTLGFGVQVETESSFGLWTYGLEYYRDIVDSFQKKYDADGSFKSESIQGPVADDAVYDNAALFLQNDVRLSPRFNLILGGRYTYARADAEKVQDPVDGGVMSLKEDWKNLAGSARLSFLLDENGRWKLFTGISQGFRAPNLSDLSRLDTARSNEIETAAPGLSPEKFTSYELGLKTNNRFLQFQTAVFYTYVHNMIVRTPTGEMIEGNVEVTKKNSGSGYVAGFELNASSKIYKGLTSFAAFSWNNGKVDTYPTSEPELEEEYIDRLMPPTANLGLQWTDQNNKYTVRALCTIAGKQDRLSTRDKADTQRIPPGGTPIYTLFSLHSSWRLTEWISFNAAIENITDEDYRIHGSGNNEPGRNFILGFDLNI